MAQQNLGDVTITNLTVSTTAALPANSFGNNQANANDPIGPTKLKHRYMPRLAQVHGTAATAERRVVHRARAAGTVLEFKVGVAVAAVGDSTVTVDLLKNGVTVLTGTVTIDSGDTAYTGIVTGTLVADPSYVAGAVFEVNVTVTPGTGTPPQGLFAVPVFDESPA